MSQVNEWRIIYVDDDGRLGPKVQNGLKEEGFQVDFISDFDKALEHIDAHRYDLLILDIFKGKPRMDAEKMGLHIEERISRIKFIPTILYTALPAAVKDRETNFLKVVGKKPGKNPVEPLMQSIRYFIESGLLQLNRGLARHLDATLANYMKKFVNEYWDKYATKTGRQALAYIIARRLALALTSEGIKEFAEELGAAGTDEGNELVTSEDMVHPMQFYIVPTMANDFRMGDLVRHKIKDNDGYWVVLTPSCDLVKNRGSHLERFAHMAFCSPLKVTPEYTNCIGSQSVDKDNKLKDLLRNKRERYHYLPGVKDITPHLIVDFQMVELIKLDELYLLNDAEHRVASLDSQYAAELLARYSRYSARVGQPELDIEGIVAALKNSPLLPIYVP